MAAQHKVTIPPKNRLPRKHFHRKDPGNTPYIRRSTSTLKTDTDQDDQGVSDHGENLDADTTGGEGNQEAKPSTSGESKITPGKFQTEEHGIWKFKVQCYFKCPVCGIHKTSTMKLNAHFKRWHEALKCAKCDKVFSTPSGLDRHKYTHLAPRHKCTECGTGFYFEGEVKQHMTTHRKVQAFTCNHGNCKKRYMNHADLLKHVRMHTVPVLQCTDCKYSTTDKCLFKCHRALHSDSEPFKCDACNKTFKHRNQLCHHKLDKTLCESRSSSPEY